MALRDLLQQPVTINHVAETASDAYGDPEPSVASTTSTKGWLDPVSETEELIEQETTRTLWRLFLPAGTTVAAGDQASVALRSLRIIEVLPFTNPRTGEAHHVECRVLEEVG